MMKSLSAVALATLLAATAPLYAQQSTTEAATDDTASEQAPTADQLLDLGTPAAPAAQIGSRYTKETYGDWGLVCVLTGTDNDPCSLTQVLNDADGGPVAEFSLFRINQEGGQAVAGATVIAPLETLLPAGVTISVDGAPGKRYNFSFCNRQGCIAQIGLTEADINAFKQGTAAIVTVRPAPAPDQTVNVTLSLKGFTAGYDVVDVVDQ